MDTTQSLKTQKKRKKICATIVSPSSSPTIDINNVEGNNITSLPKASTIAERVVQPLLCPITHALMVDPVLAEDGHTYERSSIEEWLSNNTTSPLIPNKRLKANNLTAVKIVQETIEALVGTGLVENDLGKSWKEKKKELDLIKAKKMYDEGRILDAAKLGLPEAQGEVSNWYYLGSNGMEKDFNQSLDWAKKAAEGGDRLGQFRLAYFYDAKEIPGKISRNIAAAISWYEKAANQGCRVSMHNLGLTYERGGYELRPNYLQKAAFWYGKGANEKYAKSLIKIGKFSYEGKGVTENHKTAREWFEKAVDVIDVNKEKRLWSDANYWLGKMMMKGEGGSKDLTRGFILIQEAASKELPVAKKHLESMVKVLD